MNPFSGFLQPPAQRSPLAGAAEFINDLSRLRMARQQEANRVKESAADNARADQYLKLQQSDQANRFSQQDQKQVEALLAEYQEAEDQGDPVRLSRAAQMLKRFGMDVAQAPPPLPGQMPPPSTLTASVEDQAGAGNPFTGTAGESQQEFEERLISGTQAGGESDAAEPDIAGHLKSVGPLKALPTEITSDVVDLDAEPGAKPLQIGRPELANTTTTPPPLPGMLPTVVSRGGKELYRSSGPSARRPEMVRTVFAPFVAHESPQISEAAKAAQGYAEKLIRVDGVAPKEAIEMAIKQMDVLGSLGVGLERTKLGTRPRSGGGGTTPGKFTAMGRKEDTAESIKTYITEARGAVGKLNESDRLLAQAEALVNSSDPALQRNAIDILVQSRSGATVSDRERARYDQLDGAISQVQNYVSRWTGGQLDPSYVNKIKMVIAEQRRINASTREEVAADLQEAYAAQNEGKVDAPILERRKKALGKVIRRNDTSAEGGDNSDLYE